MTEPLYADRVLLIRFAEWLFTQTTDTHSATRLHKAVLGRSSAIGAHLKAAWQNSDDFAPAFRAAFTPEEQHAILNLLGTQPGDVTWKMPEPAHQRRRERLNEVAQRHGYETWAKLETAIINDEATLDIRPTEN